MIGSRAPYPGLRRCALHREQIRDSTEQGRVGDQAVDQALKAHWRWAPSLLDPQSGQHGAQNRKIFFQAYPAAA